MDKPKALIDAEAILEEAGLSSKSSLRETHAASRTADFSAHAGIIDRLNKEGVGRAVHYQHEWMELITQTYARLCILCGRDPVIWEEETAALHETFQKPIRCGDACAVVAAGFARIDVHEVEGGHHRRKKRTMDGLRLDCVMEKSGKLPSGWMGPLEEELRDEYATSFHMKADEPTVINHVVGRLWDRARMHDLLKQRWKCNDGAKVLSFCESDTQSLPIFFPTSDRPPLKFERVIFPSDLQRAVEAKRDAIARAIEEQLTRFEIKQ